MTEIAPEFTRPVAVDHLRDVGADYALDIEVGFARRRRADADGVVHELEVIGARVSFGVDPDRHDAAFACGARDAHRDLAAVSDQQTPQRRYAIHAGRRFSRKARKPSWPSALVR